MTRYLALVPALLLAFGTAAAEDKVLATVNGKAIHENDIQEYIVENGVSAKLADNRELILNELITRELVLQEAERKGLEKRADVINQLANLRRQVLLQAALNDYTATVKINDDEVRRLYEQQLKSFSATEFKARHILLNSEDDAKKMIQELDKGADFAELARKNSTGPTASRGGDLGWFAPQNMVKPFADAVAAMKKGSYSKAPVQTRFGWHVIMLEDTRSAEPPALTDVRPQLEQAIMQQRVRGYLEELRNKAKVTVN